MASHWTVSKNKSTVPSGPTTLNQAWFIIIMFITLNQDLFNIDSKLCVCRVRIFSTFEMISNTFMWMNEFSEVPLPFWSTRPPNWGQHWKTKYSPYEANVFLLNFKVVPCLEGFCTQSICGEIIYRPTYLHLIFPVWLL